MLGQGDSSRLSADDPVELRMTTGPWPAGTRARVVEASPRGWIVVELEDPAAGATGVRLELPNDTVSLRRVDGEQAAF